MINTKDFKYSLFLFTLLVLGALAGCSDSIPPPKLSGPWFVGSTTIEIEKKDQWIQVRAWYPSQAQSTAKLLSSDQHTISAFSELIGIPEFLMGSEDESRSSLDVNVPNGQQYPVLIFNHGLMSYARQNTTQFEQLASHGYIVLSVANPGDSMVVVRKNEEIVKADKNSAAYQALEKQKDNIKALAPQLKNDIHQAKESQNFTDFSKQMTTLAQNPVFQPMIEVFKSVHKNNILLLDSLVTIQNGKIISPLAGHLDLNKIGAFGHSFGSILSGHLAMTDHRIKAAFGLDAPQLNIPDYEYKPFSIPVCYAYADTVDFAGEPINFNRINTPLLKTSGSCEALFQQSAHYNFTDLNLVPPLRYSSMLGDIDNALMANNIETLLLTFFDTHLKGQNNLHSLKLKNVNLTVY